MKWITLICLTFYSLCSWCQTPEDLLLKDFRPVSIYNTTKTQVTKAKISGD